MVTARKCFEGSQRCPDLDIGQRRQNPDVAAAHEENTDSALSLTRPFLREMGIRPGPFFAPY